jgi:hypothetical protein
VCWFEQALLWVAFDAGGLHKVFSRASYMHCIALFALCYVDINKLATAVFSEAYINCRLLHADCLDNHRSALPQPSDSDWNRPKPRHPIVGPASYPKSQPDVISAPGLFRKMDPEALFFAFYYQPDTYQQYLAAQVGANAVVCLLQMIWFEAGMCRRLITHPQQLLVAPEAPRNTGVQQAIMSLSCHTRIESSPCTLEFMSHAA